jgi:hypothetical protein
MLPSGHGKPGGSTARLSGVRGPAVIGCPVVAPRTACGRSRAAGGSTSAVGQPMGGAVEARWKTGAEKGQVRWPQSTPRPGGSTTCRAGIETWTAGSRLRNQLVDFVARGPLNRAGMRSEVSLFASLADFAAAGMELSASGGTGAGAG